MTKGRLASWFLGTAVVAALIGFLFGWYRAFPAEHARERAMVRLRISEARSRALDARVSLTQANYGDARTHLAESVRLLEAFKSANGNDLPTSEIAKVDQALQALREAATETPAGPVTDAAAVAPSSDKAAQAVNLLGEVYRATPEP